jgi:hypothetical protein
MQSAVVNVPVGIPVAFNLTLTVGELAILAASAEISFTVNDADLFLVNNRFSPAPADTAVPEPSTLLLLGTGLLAARRLRRRVRVPSRSFRL